VFSSVFSGHLGAWSGVEAGDGLPMEVIRMRCAPLLHIRSLPIRDYPKTPVERVGRARGHQGLGRGAGAVRGGVWPQSTSDMRTMLRDVAASDLGAMLSTA
jgi:hypothetical protein